MPDSTLSAQAPTSGARALFPGFRELVRARGAAAALSAETRLASSGRDETFYVPFEHVETRARLAIVGITPGPNQATLAFAEAARLLALGRDDADVLRGAKSAAAFGGPAMRPNLVRLLDALDIPALVGAPRADALWTDGAALVHSTSVVPHAALRGGKPFAGSFADVLGSPPFAESHELDFLPTLASLPNALLLALGPTPLAALDRAAALGLVDPARVLGALPHPSSQSGSQVDVYLGLRRPESLKNGDPVRDRLGFLLPAAERVRGAVAALRSRRVPARATDVASEPAKGPKTAPKRRAEPPTASIPREPAPAAPSAPTPAPAGMEDLHYVVERGANARTTLRPHVHADGRVVVSPSRFEKDYVRLARTEPIEPWLARGYRLRMSAPGVAPSLIAPASIRGRRRQ